MSIKLLIYWTCIAFVMVITLGWSTARKLRELNHKYHIIEVEHNGMYDFEDEEYW